MNTVPSLKLVPATEITHFLRLWDCKIILHVVWIPHIAKEHTNTFVKWMDWSVFTFYRSLQEIAMINTKQVTSCGTKSDRFSRETQGRWSSHSSSHNLYACYRLQELQDCPEVCRTELTSFFHLPNSLQRSLKSVLFKHLDRSTTDSGGERIERSGYAVVGNLLQKWYFFEDSKILP